MTIPIEDRIITIPSQQMPSQKHEVQIVAPLFKDRMAAVAAYPQNPTQERALGYSIEQLMVSLSIIRVNGQPISRPRDPIENLKAFCNADSMWLSNVFLEAFFVGEDLTKNIKAFCERVNANPSDDLTIPASMLPSKSFSVSLRAPSTGDVITSDSKYQREGGRDQGYLAEERLLAQQIIALNGVETPAANPVISVIEDWYHIDAQYVLGIFLNCFYVNDERKRSASEFAKKLSLRSKPDKSSMAVAKKAT